MTLDKFADVGGNVYWHLPQLHLHVHLDYLKLKLMAKNSIIISLLSPSNEMKMLSLTLLREIKLPLPLSTKVS